MTRASDRDDYLYSDFYEGFLKLLMVLVPIIIGWLYKYMSDDIQGFAISLVVSIVNQFYAARTSYKETSIKNVRIKIENALILIVLAIAFIITLYISLKNNVTNTSQFKWPVILFFISLCPTAFEIAYTFFCKDLRINMSFKNEKSNSAFFIDLKSANKN